VPATHSSSIDLASIPAPPSAVDQPAASPISLAPVSAADAGAGAAVTDAPQETAPPPAREPRPAPATPVRHHTVAKGDTLFSLAQKYYGSRSKWRDIFAANRDVLASENSPLRIGVDLKIP